MAIPPLRKIKTGTNELRQVQDATEQTLRSVISKEILDGAQLSSVALKTGQANLVVHGLGRDLVGWIVTGKNANATVWDEQGQNSMPSRTLRLKASADCTVNLWVY